jgi:hypothetical protein
MGIQIKSKGIQIKHYKGIQSKYKGLKINIKGTQIKYRGIQIKCKGTQIKYREYKSNRDSEPRRLTLPPTFSLAASGAAAGGRVRIMEAVSPPQDSCAVSGLAPGMLCEKGV